MEMTVPAYALTSRCPLLSIQSVLEFSVRVPLPIQSRPDDTFYVTQDGDNLPTLAFQFYGDVRLWWVLYDINAEQIMGHPLSLAAGVTLRVPSRQAVDTELLNGPTI